MSTAARDRIFESIHAASGSGAQNVTEEYAALHRPYQRMGALAAEERVHLMIERLREYDADVVEATSAELPKTVAAQLAASGRHTFVAPSGLPKAWLADGYDWLVDNDLSQGQIEAVDGVVTASFCGVADSGTIVLHHSPTEGRRILTLLPDWHLCVLRASQIVEKFPEYVARCAEPPKLATYISGPSATADIEMTRIKGVHGPRFMNVIIVRDDQ